MAPIAALLRRSFTASIAPLNATEELSKRLLLPRRSSGSLSRCLVEAVAVSHAFVKLPLNETAASSKKETNRRVAAQHEDPSSRLEGSSNSGPLLVGLRESHAKTLKSDGFTSGSHNIDDATEVFDCMLTGRNTLSCNMMISGCVARKRTREALGILSRMMSQNIYADEDTFTLVLRMLLGKAIPFRFVKEIHGKIICHGFGNSPLVGNPLIDLYSKDGFVDDANDVFDMLCSRDSMSWVAMISGLSQNGLAKEAALLFCRMRKHVAVPTPYLLSSALSVCTKIEFFELGQQVHGLIFKWGFSTQVCVCNALITLYCRAAKWIFAELIFDGMELRDAVSYNSLISGLAQHGFCEKALKMYETMQADCLRPNHVTVASLLSACASAEYLQKGKQLHSYAIKTGILSDIVIEGSLLDLYVKCSDIKTAYEFFLSTNKQSVVLWNLMLVAFGQLGNLTESGDILRQMHIKGIVPNQYTYPSILKTCTYLGALEQGEQMHSCIIKNGFQHNVYVCSVLIDMYAKHGKLDAARNIISRLAEEDIVSWTTMMAGYMQHDFFTEALQLLREMQNCGIPLDNIGLSSAITACAGIRALNHGRQIHARSWVSGYSLDLSIRNALVSLYSRCGRAKEAYAAFEKVDFKDNVSWNALISGFVQSGYHEEALQIFAWMSEVGVEVNFYTLCSAASAAANIANMILGRQIHALMIRTGCYTKIEASNVLITLYARCGHIVDAKREFDDMPEKNEVSWNSMITGYSQHGHGHEAVDLFHKMIQQGMTPNYVTFIGVLSACSHVGLVNDGLKHFESMKEHFNLVPKPEHYACVVDLLGRAGHLQHAKKFVEEMPTEPDSMIWRTLLSACTIHKNVEIGEFAALHLQGIEPQDSAVYVLLSNMYALTRKWDCRDRTRQVMKQRGVKKEPGRSWIEIKNSVHAFYAGDILHPLADEIYKRVADLTARSAEMGYVHEQCSLWSEAEQGRKDPTAFVHSEKLAIAFGFLSLPEFIPIHVMKNIRICGDCHNWIKFVSRITNRTIVVRDTYRFHHFSGGLCSCSDYW